MSKTETRQRGLFGDILVIHDWRGSPKPPLETLKPWRLCDAEDCGEMAIQRNGQGFACGDHGPGAAE